MKRKKIVLVPRLMDADNFNPQNSNAQNILSRISAASAKFIALHYNQPRADLVANKQVNLIKLWRWRFWRLSAWLAYQKKIDAIFYPGGDISDDLGWRFRDFLGRRIPIIATLEGLVGNPEREREYSEWAGHQVYCQHVDDKVLARIDRLYQRADHIIAISPFLAEMGRRRYGDKFSVIPLGVDASLFFSDDTEKHARMTVIGAGRLYENKRPELFIELASRHPDADFIWYGWGELLASLRDEVKRKGLRNIDFPGPAKPEELAAAMRNAHLFLLPSKSEGVPKVSQEAAACGLPLVMFGYYEAPTLVHGENGVVVWSDEELINAVAGMLNDREKLDIMGERSAAMAKAWGWELVAMQWLNGVEAVATGEEILSQ